MPSSLYMTDSPDAQPLPLTTSERFNASDADVVFKSRDNVLFHIHRKNLETHSAGFPPSEFSTNGEIVNLTEDAIDYLFQSMYPMEHPDIESMPFEDLANLAEAAEKYEVFGSVKTCYLHLKQIAPKHPQEIFEYATKHDYRDILSIAAPLLLDIPLNVFVKTLPSHMIIPWIEYYNHWNNIVRSAVETIVCVRRLDGTFSPDLPLLEEWFALGDKRSRASLKEFCQRRVCPFCEDPACFKEYFLAQLNTEPQFATFL